MEPYTLFVYLVWLLATYFNITLLLVLFKNRDILFTSPSIEDTKKLPKVSIIVPAYNEEKGIADCLESLKNIDYPGEMMEIIIVNDGSKDKTSEVVRRYKNQPNLIFLDNPKNKGKAASLNQGISIASGELVACMDADSVVKRDILKKTVPYFKDKKVAATIVAVKVRNPRNLLERMIEIEYILGLALSLKALSLFGSIHVTPGPFSLYRKSVLDELGGFDIHNITEDLEIAHRIQKKRYKIACCLTTHVETTVPPNLKRFYSQRRRWYTGALLTFWKHRNLAFNRKMGMFAVFFPFNYILILAGLTVFLTSSYLFISKIAYKMTLYSLTDFNFFEHISLKDIDPLTFGMFGFLGVTAIISVFILVYCGLKLTKNSLVSRKLPFVGYWALFFAYQFVWTISLLSAVFKKNIKWR